MMIETSITVPIFLVKNFKKLPQKKKNQRVNYSPADTTISNPSCLRSLSYTSGVTM